METKNVLAPALNEVVTVEATAFQLELLAPGGDATLPTPRGGEFPVVAADVTAQSLDILCGSAEVNRLATEQLHAQQASRAADAVMRYI